MKIYVSIVEDRHIDTEVKAFASPDDAVRYAKVVIEHAAARWDNAPADEALTDRMKRAGWLYYGHAYEDGPSAQVVALEVE